MSRVTRDVFQLVSQRLDRHDGLFEQRQFLLQSANVDIDRAAELLDASGGSVRTAIVMAVRGLDRASAEALLARHNGVIGRALAASQE